MTNKTITRDEFHRYYAGEIKYRDFYSYNTLSDIAFAIKCDEYFNDKCLSNIKQRNKEKQFKKENN